MENEINTVADTFFETCGIRVLKSLRQIIRAVDIHSKSLNQEFKVTAPQLTCLYSLQKNGEMTHSALTKEVDLGMSTVNGIIDRLETKGWVMRERDKADRRKIFVRLTPAGKAFTEEAPSLLHDRLSNAMRALPELEQAAIAVSLERVVELMCDVAVEQEVEQ